MKEANGQNPQEIPRGGWSGDFERWRNKGEKNRMSRSRNWVGIAYPENLKDGWLEILNSKGVQALDFPLHDSDVYERDIEKDGKIEHKKGDKKKAPFSCCVHFR